MLFEYSKIMSDLGGTYFNWKSRYSRNKKRSKQICHTKGNRAPRETARRRKEGN